MIIKEPKELAELLKECKEEKVIAVDTEFDRRNTYYPKLCLIQIATSKRAFAIDVLDKRLKLSGLKSLLKDKNILKIFHSAREDVEVIYTNLDIIPEPIFDTQVAANVLEMGETPSYAGLVESMLGVYLDKSVQFSDWTKRPLTKTQIKYAIADVVHLRELYMEFVKILLKNRESIKVIENECIKFQMPERYENPPDEAWKKLNYGRLSKDALKVFKKLAAWRERKAKEINVPRQWIIPNALIRKLAIMAEKKEKLENLEEIQYLIKKGKLEKSAIKELHSLLK